MMALVNMNRAARDIKATADSTAAIAAEESHAVQARSADRVVPGHGTLVEGQGTARDVEAAPKPVAAVARDIRDADRVVPGHGDVVEGHSAAGHGDAAPPERAEVVPPLATVRPAITTVGSPAIPNTRLT